MTQEIRTLQSSDLNGLASITSEAFAEDPVMTWTIPDEQGRLTLFTNLARHEYLPGGGHIVPDLGATMWRLSTEMVAGSVGADVQIGFGLFKHGGLGAISRSLTLRSVMMKHKPSDPYAYLFTIGVRGKARGTGLGHRLLDAFLQEAGKAGLPAYLENSNPANTRFYESHGFQETEVFSPKGAPPLQGMLVKAP